MLRATFEFVAAWGRSPWPEQPGRPGRAAGSRTAWMRWARRIRSLFMAQDRSGSTPPSKPRSKRCAAWISCCPTTARTANGRDSTDWPAEQSGAGLAGVFRPACRCVEYSRQSEGAFDITVGPLMKVWGFYKGSRPDSAPGRNPGRHEPHRLAEHHSGFARTRTVRFRRSGLRSIQAESGRATPWTIWGRFSKESGITSGDHLGWPVSSIYAMGHRPTSRAVGK